ncbi:MAG: helix-turn-helix domain-containing protein [Bacteroidales bacterium]|nr:helix-turn-helix domain-containing protein [Bacteroidales bacterium]
MEEKGIKVRFLDRTATMEGGSHMLPFPGFVYVTGGDLVVESESQLFQCSAGHLLFMPEGVAFSLRHSADLQGIEVSFKADDLRDASHPVLHRQHALQHTFWFQDAALMGALLTKMAEASENGNVRMLRSGIDLALCMLGPAGDTAEDVPGRFLKLVFDHGGPILGVSDYAEQLGVSTGYLNRVVRNKTFRSPMDWVGISRIGKAKDLLRGTRMSMAEVADAVGIDDQSYFARFFRKMTGITPREYREGGPGRD